MMKLKSMSLSALVVVHSARAFPLAIPSQHQGLRARRCRHTAAAPPVDHWETDGKKHGRRTRMEAGAAPDSPPSALGRGREVFSLAPMMEYTDRHMRYLLRLLTTRTVLWTEMVPSSTIIHNPDDLGRFLDYNEEVEHPVVLQIGGSDTTDVREACRLARPYKYDAINLNCGCPSEKVAGKGAFGAALMRSPSLVKDLCLAMKDGAGEDTPITVKCRIGVDNDDSYEQLAAFVEEVSRGAGVPHFIVHARKAILGGLSPAQNRNIPPLKYDFVYRLVKDFPDVDFTLNGGVNTYEEAVSCLEQGAHGVMVGRSWSSNPWYWSQADSMLFGAKDPGLTRREVLERYAEYGERQEKACGEKWLACRRRLAKPIWHMFHGEKGGKKFRVALEGMLREDKSFGEIVQKSLLAMPQDQVDWLPGENWRARQAEEGAGQGESLAQDPGCVSSLPSPSSRGVPDGRFRDGRLLYIDK
ncbi:FAD binding / catalytic/ tRNA dihydrouridine synthase [Ectocarpus siliculosus]|uniref:FAD binding / catalytic/ tRNA dihydrouridine synthase n=1 Tax=Ectocarpus siliculosus TaxID=2880 RepID=D7FQR5_ECTSI|nr:FAD binding / catalytic/ tRNA dihydrouridine synthase [Ectocarpus siliculosus]|eukprot:CBJ49172.1 FAD binding / catalytic/ tRNA dihydrouridine synthase [Ectocarpus siliculosus]